MRVPAPLAAALLSTVAVAACGSDSPTAPATPQLSASASAYLKQALDFEQEVFIYRSQINWPSMRSDVTRIAGAAQNPAGTYNAIDSSIAKYFVPLGDHHSAFFRPSQAPGRTDSPSNDPRFLVSGSMMTANVAYMNVPTFAGRNPVGRADSTLTVIRALDANKPCGWIVDLRLNPGGTWASMMSGINPLVGNGTFGGLVDSDNAQLLFYVQNGEAGVLDPSNNQRYPQVKSTTTYTLSRPNAPVALLQGPFTASAGELIILSFRGSSVPMRTFGDNTYGLTTTPAGIYMQPDSAYLNITFATMFDRTGKRYGDVLVPDQRIPQDQQRAPAPGVRDAAVDAALAWLASRPECGGTGVSAQRAPLPSGALAAELPGHPSPNAHPERVARHFMRGPALD